MIRIYIVYKYGDPVSAHFDREAALSADGDIEEHFIKPAEICYLLNELAASGRLCENCHNYVDPDVCWCGEIKGNHTAPHTFVPMGCECHRSKD